ncbi:MAG: hypothetical protein JWO35_760 [Candidatus Saccharibacteria bacterium]|nr:hypothetical protein [Candidatus Saccharibacteria bacterium]
MKFTIKLNPASIGNLVALSVFSVALVGGVGSQVASAATASTGGAEAKTKPYTPTPACIKQLSQVNGYKDDLARFKSNHYVLPTDLSNYEQKPMKQSDGKTILPTYTGVGTVPSYVDGKLVQVKRVNYPLILQRHEGAIGAIQAKKSVNTQVYAATIANLKASIGAAATQIDTLSQNWTTDNANCANPVEAKKTRELSQKRTIQLKLVTKVRAGVDKDSKNASKAYSAAARAFAKAKS